MGVVQAVVTMAKKSGIPADAVENTFNFAVAADNPTTTELNNIQSALTNFYNTSHTFGGTSGTLMSIFGNSINNGAATGTIKYYVVTGHLDGSPHGSPTRTDPFTPATTSLNEAPNQLAVCLSFQSAYGSDVEFAPGSRPRARDRGRIYLGPVSLDILDQDSTTKEPFVLLAARNKVAGAAVALRDDANTTWVVWSRANVVTHEVVSGWVDNAFDIVRRRRNKATIRGGW